MPVAITIMYIIHASVDAYQGDSTFMVTFLMLLDTAPLAVALTSISYFPGFSLLNDIAFVPSGMEIQFSLSLILYWNVISSVYLKLSNENSKENVFSSYGTTNLSEKQLISLPSRIKFVR